MKMTGDELKEKIGNVAMRFDCADLNTGYSPAAAAVTAPSQKPVPGFNLN
ncbi:MAG: hypothetical protein NDJ24_03320 [Alphaproteobacteria bacterium]|nr:hypothetical protein [Alphaproteobacteria bacterium]